jgi:hypothetical protein
MQKFKSKYYWKLALCKVVIHYIFKYV